MYTIHSGKTRLAVFLALFTACAAAFFLTYRSSFSWADTSDLSHTKWSSLHFPEHSDPPQKYDLPPDEVVLIVASQTKDNTTWLETGFPSWKKAIYLTDAPSNLSVAVNKGREGMVYLSYIIDNYDYLPSIMIFQHANRYQWHNDDPLYDGQRLLSRLRLPHIQAQGYVNLRCVWTIGCPAELHPIKEYEAVLGELSEPKRDSRTGSIYKEAFEALFPGKDVPEDVGVSCCAQFAVTRDKVRQRPKSDYEGYRQWLLETDLPDDISGRVLEYSWHIIFGEHAVHCPNAAQCYCDVYGLCELECEGAGVCRDQYTTAKSSTLPEGWPEYDWDGNWQNVTQLRIDQEVSQNTTKE